MIALEASSFLLTVLFLSILLWHMPTRQSHNTWLSKLSLVTFGERHRLKAGIFEFFMSVGGSNCGLLVYDTMQPLRWVPVVSKNMLPPSSGSSECDKDVVRLCV